MASAQEREPRTLDRYTLHGVIASGGMASVHFGRLVGAHGFARTVAIKRLHPQFATDPDFTSMLLDEARLAVRIRHPNVVATLDSVQADGELFLVMEYIPGESLASLLREAGRGGGRVPPPIGSAIVAGALAGLHAAHEATAEDGVPLQIVHRDVSPQNILVGEDGIARVLDFGIARAAVRSQVSREGQLKGKLSYMAPEQLRGDPLTRRTDIYAAAVVLWEVLTGRRLFTGDNDAVIFGRILEGVIQPPSAFIDVPAEVDQVVLRGLERDPRQRYASALEMATALEAALPPASPRAVGAWVEETAGALLTARSRSLAEIETSQRSPSLSTPLPSTPTVADRARARPAPPPEPRACQPRSSVTLPTLTRTVEDMVRPKAPVLVTAVPTAAPSLRRTARVARAAVFAIAAGALAVAALASQRCGVRPELEASSAEPPRAGPVSPSAATAVAAAQGAPAAPASASAKPPASASARPPPGAAAPASASAAAATPASASARAPAAPASASARAGATERPGAAATARPRPRSPCVPPYYVDEKGIRRIKRECL
ncbi:protein kinase [Sorangium cellulosum]|uniref:Protein kinase n=1 Tax=Sorangium cellulosum TaxID=56 RepID=A0A2L0ETP0_SORCE|nr:serine/threonine-protein kinase [Sorangium cellulosum]AUX42678.1 protein kinase [Sorangium cellulosum]